VSFFLTAGIFLFCVPLILIEGVALIGYGFLSALWTQLNIGLERRFVSLKAFVVNLIYKKNKTTTSSSSSFKSSPNPINSESLTNTSTNDNGSKSINDQDPKSELFRASSAFFASTEDDEVFKRHPPTTSTNSSIQSTSRNKSPNPHKIGGNEGKHAPNSKSQEVFYVTQKYEISSNHSSSSTAVHSPPIYRRSTGEDTARAIHNSLNSGPNLSMPSVILSPTSTSSLQAHAYAYGQRPGARSSSGGGGVGGVGSADVIGKRGGMEVGTGFSDRSNDKNSIRSMTPSARSTESSNVDKKEAARLLFMLSADEGDDEASDDEDVSFPVFIK
jgi:hypothetical protein